MSCIIWEIAMSCIRENQIQTLILPNKYLNTKKKFELENSVLSVSWQYLTIDRLLFPVVIYIYVFNHITKKLS